MLHLGYGDDIRQSLYVGRFHQIRRRPGQMQYIVVIKFEAVEIVFESAPRMRAQQVGEIVGQLRFGQGVNLIMKILARTSYRTRVGIDRFRPHAFEFETFELRLIRLLEIWRVVWFHDRSSLCCVVQPVFG